MAKAVVVYTILTTAFVLLLILPTSHKSHKGHRHIHLTHRFGRPKGPHFDPLLTKMELKGEKKALNATIDHDNFHENVHELMLEGEVEEEDEVYFGEDGKLNLTLRLKILFPMIDNSPRDGQIGFRELEAWNIIQAKERLAYTTRNQLEAYDMNKDGLISFNEYLPQFSDQDIKENKMERGEAGWWMQKFTNADSDHNGNLSFEELKDFLHPEDSNNSKLQEWLLRDKTRRMDWDNDGKLNFWEFRDNAYDIFRKYQQFSTGQDHVPSPEEQYADLDLNKDRLLTIQELIPIRHFLFPGELDYASYETTYLMTKVDDDQNGTLNIDEILNHEDKFYNIIYVGDMEGDDDQHDEF